MNKKKFVLAITGPTGSGKSTISETVAKEQGDCVNIDANSVKRMVVSGFYYEEAFPDDPGRWGFTEWGLVGDSIGVLARNFLNKGYNVIINGYMDEPAWTNIEKHVSFTHKILLLPRVETAIERDAGRSGDIQMGKEVVEKQHDHFSTAKAYVDFMMFDSSDLSEEETLEAVTRILEGRYETL
jgi:cytidylate kinase